MHRLGNSGLKGSADRSRDDAPFGQGIDTIEANRHHTENRTETRGCPYAVENNVDFPKQTKS